MTYPVEIRKERTAYTAHRSNADRRGIPFEISFDDWFAWWKTDNRWERRGNRPGDFVMARWNDEGPYRLDNVFCATVEDNLHRRRKGVPAEEYYTMYADFHSHELSPSLRLHAAMTALHWGPLAVAHECGLNERTVRRWWSGQFEPPADVVAWVERLVEAHRALPPPERRGRPTAPPGGAGGQT